MDKTIKIGEALELLPYLTDTMVGFGIAQDGVDGVQDGVASKSVSTGRADAIGDYDVPLLFDSRLVPLKGTCVANSANELQEFGELINGTMAADLVKVVFGHFAQLRWGMATLAPSTKVTFKPDSRTLSSRRPKAAWSVQLKFANPRLYGETEASVPAGTPLHNMGNFRATPVHRVSGSAPQGYTIGGPVGRTYQVTRPLVNGIPHLIRMDDGKLIVDGKSVSGGRKSADTWAIPGGDFFAHTLTAPSGAPVLASGLFHTYM